MFFFFYLFFLPVQSRYSLSLLMSDVRSSSTFQIHKNVIAAFKQPHYRRMHADLQQCNFPWVRFAAVQRNGISLHLHRQSMAIDGWLFLGLWFHVLENMASTLDIHRC